MFKSIFLPLIAVAAFITLVGLLSQGKFDSILKRNEEANNSNAKVMRSNLKIIKIENTEIEVEVARTSEERSKGLGGRTSLAENSGMVFVFNQNSTPVFWMKDTKIPLDLIWINDNKIIGIDKNVPVEEGVADKNLKKYPAPSAVDYVLEVNAGFSDKNSIKVGQSLSGLEQL